MIFAFFVPIVCPNFSAFIHFFPSFFSKQNFFPKFMQLLGVAGCSWCFLQAGRHSAASATSATTRREILGLAGGHGDGVLEGEMMMMMIGDDW